MFAELVRSLRPHQWVKNLFVLAPLVFAEKALVAEDFVRAAVACALFCLLSGCVYILNDLADVEGDRAHPTKRERPIASGRLPLPAARMALALLLLGTIGASFALSVTFAAIGLAYFTLNVGYSLALKHIPFVDVSIIASGFLLRIAGGAAAIEAPVTLWILLCTLLLALYLGLGKRKHELLSAGAGASAQRRVLARYRFAHVRLAMIILAVATLASYAAYTLVGTHPALRFDPSDLVWTVPLVGLGLWRFYQLTHRTDDGRSPTDLMLTDWPFLGILAAWGITVFVVIYVL